MTWPGEGASHGFGQALSSSGRWLVVGSEDDDEAARGAGAAWLFHDTSSAGDWSEWTSAKLVSPEPWKGDEYGAAVALGDGWVAVGAPEDDTAGVDNGAVYMYRTDTLGVADLAVSIEESADPVIVGETLTYTAVVFNRGVSEATDLEVVWDLAGDAPIVAASGTGWSCGQVAGTVTCRRASLAAGMSSAVAVTVAPTHAGEVASSVRVSAEEADLGQADNSAEVATTVYEPLSATQADALESLFRATGGAEWTDASGWGGAGHPCTWKGVSCSADGREVTEISLPESNLTGPLPADIGRLTSLKKLILSRNRLQGAIPAEIGDCTALEELRLDGNNLRGEIPAAITRLQALKPGGSSLSWNALWTSDVNVHNFLSSTAGNSLNEQARPVELSLTSGNAVGPRLVAVRTTTGYGSGILARFELFERMHEGAKLKPLRLSGGVGTLSNRFEVVGPFEPGATRRLTARAIFYPHTKNPYNTVVSDLGPELEVTTPASTERWVATGGTDAGVCDSAEAPCETVQYAVDQAGAGDTIHLAAGVYKESVNVTTSISLLGEGARFTLIDADGADSAIRVGAVGQPVMISGLALTGAKVAGLTASTEVVAVDVEARDNGGAGVQSTARLTLDGVTVSGNGDGGVVVTSRSAVLTNVTISGNLATTNGRGPGFFVSNTWGESSRSSLLGCAVVSNSGAEHGGVAIDAGSALPIVRDSVVALNAPADCGDDDVTSLGVNADSDGTCGLDPSKGDLSGIDPGLRELADNGGPTRTHALAEDSPLRDALASSTCRGEINAACGGHRAPAATSGRSS